MTILTVTRPIPNIQRELPLIGSMSKYNADRLGFCLRVAHECGDVGRRHAEPFHPTSHLCNL